MARIYYNTGGSGRDHSQIHLARVMSDKAAITLYRKGISLGDIVLNKEQILDLIYQLQIVVGNAKEELPIIEGSI